jgi:hypothetical protein
MLLRLSAAPVPIKLAVSKTEMQTMQILADIDPDFALDVIFITLLLPSVI